MKFTAKPLYVRTDDEVRGALDRLRKHDRTAGVADIVRAAIIEKADRDIPARVKKREFAQE